MIVGYRQHLIILTPNGHDILLVEMKHEIKYQVTDHPMTVPALDTRYTRYAKQWAAEAAVHAILLL